MNRRNVIALLFVTLASFVIAGCRTAPVMNIEESPITISGKYSSKDVRKAIIRAGTSLGWRVKDVKPGHLEATLLIRKHMAKVDIFYDKKKYSIKYKDSSNLNYDGTNIHSNYNGWIQNLDRSIQAQLATL